MTKKLTTKEFIRKAKDVHGDKYDYSKAEYVLSNIKVTIICPLHGEFQQRPNGHLSGLGCFKCGVLNRAGNLETFIEKSSKIHNNKYDYSKVIYKNIRTPVTIICKEHGEFSQKPSLHLQGKGCAKCGYIKRSSYNKKDVSIFIEEALKVHGDKYNYSLVNYELGTKHVDIICKVHGVFKQTPNSHIQGHGCLKCKHEAGRLAKEDFIRRSSFTHDNFYDYSLVEYTVISKKVKIVCPEHGVFKQTPAAHLQGQGCPCCCLSGFDPYKPAILYYVRIDTEMLPCPMYKIGITNRSVRDRFSKSEYNMMTELSIKHYDSGEDAFNKEKEILKEFQEYLYKGEPLLRSGNTEIFVYDILNLDKAFK